MSMSNHGWWFLSFLVGSAIPMIVAAVHFEQVALMPSPLRIQRAHSSSTVERSYPPPSLTSTSSASLRELQLPSRASGDEQQSPRSQRSTTRLIRQSPIITDRDRGRYEIASPTGGREPAQNSVEVTRWEKSLLQYKQEEYEAAAKNINRLSFATLPLYYNRALIYMQWYLKTTSGKLLHYALMDTDRAIAVMRHFYPAYVAKARITFFMRRYRAAYDVLCNLKDLLELQVADRNCILYDTREYVGVIYLADVVLNMALLAFRFGSDRTSNEHFELALQIIHSDIERAAENHMLLYIYEDRLAQYHFVRKNKLLIPDLLGMWMEPIRSLQQTDLIPTQFTSAREAFSVDVIANKYTSGHHPTSNRRREGHRTGVSPLRHVTSTNDIIMARQTLPGEVVTAPPLRSNKPSPRPPLHEFSIQESPNDAVVSGKKKSVLKRMWRKITCQ